MRPVCPPEMPKTISIPASSRTRATSALAGISSVSICSMAIVASSLTHDDEACLAGGCEDNCPGTHQQLHMALQPPIEPRLQLQQIFKFILACRVGLTLTALCSLGVER